MNLEVEITDDRLKAFLIIKAEAETETKNEDEDDLKIESSDIKKALAKNNINYGIKETKFKEILAEPNKSKKILIAEGKAPVPGKDGRLIFNFDENKKNIGTLRADGTMDFHSLNLINNIRKGEKIVTKVKSKPGKPGMSVNGRKIAAPKVKSPKLPHSLNTCQKDNSLYAAIDGQIVREYQKIVVKEVYTVNGDVDLSTGNIDFVGSVKVNGDVKDGFKIKADGDIEISGNVGCCELKSTGNILIKKGFIGRNEGTASADGEFFARFIENVTIEAENVRVAETIMHSDIKACGGVEVTRGRGLVVGGKINSRNYIEANLIGSRLATKTVLEIGMMSEVKEKLKEAKKEKEKVEENLNKIKKSIKILESIQKRGIKLPPEKIKILGKIKKTQLQLNEKNKEIEKNIEELCEEINNAPEAFVKVRECIFPGVQILSTHDKKTIRDKTTGSKFKEINKEIRQIPN